jgi:hypothetical protein
MFFFDQTNYLEPEELAKYVNPYIIYYKKPSVGNAIQVRLKLVPCKELIARGKTDTITASSEGSVKSNYKEFGFCVDDEGHEFELGADNAIELFSLSLYPCALTNGNCKSPADLGKFVSSISFPQPVSNFGDYKSPISYVTETSEWVGLSTLFYVVNYHSLRVNEVMQERGFLSQLETTHKYVSVDKSTNQIRNRDASETTCTDDKIDYCLPYIVHNFLMTNKKMKIVRSYKGIVESISEIGGMIDLIFMIFVLFYSFYHHWVVKSFLIKEIYGLVKSPSKFNFCKWKNRAEVSAVTVEDQPNFNEAYKKAEGRIEKDLDIVALVEELNVIKIFLVDSFGLTFPGDPNRFATLKQIDDSRLKNETEKRDNKTGAEFSRQFSATPHNTGQPRSGSLARESSGFTKPQALQNSPDYTPQGQQKYRKSLLSNTAKKPAFDQTSKFSKMKPETDSQMQLSEFELAQNKL